MKIRIYIILFLGYTLINGCSTKKNTAITRTYHNVTAKYNILFNGNESFKKAGNTLVRTHQDDYTNILPVFLFGTEEAASSIGSDMDRSIKKATKLIQMHSITVKPELKERKQLTQKKKEFYNQNEFNKYVDDAYLLMGKAHFYKMEYGQAAETFQYLISNFNHTPKIFETKIWMARLHNEKKEYREAFDYLDELSKNIEFPKKHLDLLYTTFADHYIKQENYKEAIPYLIKSIDVAKRKWQRIRYSFILAQVYEKEKAYIEASQYYRKVIKMNPPYEMTFHAKINRALSYQSGVGERREIEAELKKMLRDDKNIDYQDQIYFALGNIYFKENDLTKAIDYYKESINASEGDMGQLARTNLALADIYYNQPDYINAQAYYDSAVVALDMSYPNYDLIYAKSVSLTKLVENIRIVELEDSVQALARLPKPELLARIDDIIEQVRLEEEEQRRIQELEMEEQLEISTTAYEMERDMATQTGSWYFYNPTVVNIGKKEFKQRWGSRKLEDNWRRRNKQTISFASTTSEESLADSSETSESSNQKKVLSNKTRDYYLQNIPLTDSMLTESHNRIKTSLFTIGEIYQEDLKDYQKAYNTYNQLLERYHDLANKLEVYYNLYLISKDLKNEEKANFYKQKIIGEYPASSIAKLLSNPNYIKELREEERKVYNYYQTTYNLYKQQNFTQASTRARYAMENYKGHELIPQFDYILTVAEGKFKQAVDFKIDLLQLISKYPNTGIAENAKLLMAYLDKENPEVITIEQERKAEVLFHLSADEEHFFGFITPKSKNINQLIFNVINFNLDHFPEQNLTVKKTEINKDYNICLIESFNNVSDAMNYLNLISTNEEVYKDVTKEGIDPVLISKSNYAILLKEKQVPEYVVFFNNNY